MTVLVIHDTNQTPLKAGGTSDIPGILTTCDCPFVEATSLKDALMLLTEKVGAIHTIIVNYRIIMENGNFLKQLTSTTTLRDIPLILRVDVQEQDRIKPFKHSAPYLWLQHPFTASSLYSMVLSAESEFAQRRALRREIHSRESVIGAITRGTFRIKTFDQAEALTTMLSLACPEPDRVAFGLFELLANGIEHGNLSISHEEKRELMAENKHRDEIQRRLHLPENKDKYVEIVFERESNLVTFKITDQGNGFDHDSYLEDDLLTNQTHHGRGIALARATSFDYLEYLDKGNKVLAVTKFNL
ncbi:ATP-binding protein [Paremcibacter congregatus]|uniref:ATP-binding protein n=1 Tax=Paremcibacter congregatus TaxID=2043170 RepID=UPI0030EB6296|tara:strand:+ start:559 stop:1461 length:903 start_codon:yes stop_codon:yes gene_type:complete